MVRRTRPNKGGRIAVSCVQKTPGGTRSDGAPARPKRPAPKWVVLIPSRPPHSASLPKSHNHCGNELEQISPRNPAKIGELYSDSVTRAALRRPISRVL